MWHDWRYKSNTAFPFTFHQTHTGRILESFYEVKGDAAQQRRSLWGAEQFCGIKKQLCEEGWIPDCFPGSSGREVGEPAQGERPLSFVLSPLHPGASRDGDTQRAEKIGNKIHLGNGWRAEGWELMD